MKYKCPCCHEVIGKDAVIVTGVLKIQTCPTCGCDEIKEIKETK